jgi:hypothetical protein
MDPQRALEIIGAAGLAIVHLSNGPVYLMELTDTQRAEVIKETGRSDSLRLAKKYIKVTAGMEELQAMVAVMPMEQRRSVGPTIDTMPPLTQPTKAGGNSNAHLAIVPYRPAKLERASEARKAEPQDTWSEAIGGLFGDIRKSSTSKIKESVVVRHYKCFIGLLLRAFLYIPLLTAMVVTLHGCLFVLWACANPRQVVTTWFWLIDLPRAYFVWVIKEAWQQVKEEAKAAAGFR